VPLEQLIKLCEKRNITCIALTDHNEIAGAVALAKIAPAWLKVIVGEEVASREGDVIGLFLKEKIPARLPLEETIAAIRAQGGVVLLPHPTDRIRHEAVGAEVAEKVAKDIDFIETFNARTVLRGDNQSAKEIAEKNDIPQFVGSDAHTPSEYGHALNLLQPFTTPAEFIESLKKASFVSRPSSVLVHFNTALVKRIPYLRKH